MMGAVINIGAVIGEDTMIDMGAVLGGRATVGKRCHVGAGAVLAGVVEPASAKPVIVGDDVLIGANAVVLEGVEIGKNAVIAAGRGRGERRAGKRRGRRRACALHQMEGRGNPSQNRPGRRVALAVSARHALPHAKPLHAVFYAHPFLEKCGTNRSLLPSNS